MLFRSADVFVINKSDRKGSAETKRDLEQMLDLSDLGESAWRPPIVQTTATTSSGISEMWDAVLAHREFTTKSGELQRRREVRLRHELREIIERRLEDRARQVCTGSRWDELQAEVLAHRTDPWSAADEMLKGIGG